MSCHAAARPWTSRRAASPEGSAAPRARGNAIRPRVPSAPMKEDKRSSNVAAHEGAPDDERRWSDELRGPIWRGIRPCNCPADQAGNESTSVASVARRGRRRVLFRRRDPEPDKRCSYRFLKKLPLVMLPRFLPRCCAYPVASLASPTHHCSLVRAPPRNLGAHCAGAALQFGSLPPARGGAGRG